MAFLSLAAFSIFLKDLVDRTEGFLLDLFSMTMFGIAEMEINTFQNRETVLNL